MEKQKEIETVGLMIEKYCRGNHGSKKGVLCPECRELLEYAKLRREKCPHGDNKPFCSNCSIHCYKPDMKEKIRLVMRYSGPRMITDHPVIAMKHLIETKKEKKRMEAKKID
ncbi:MAG: nitrous oxide-stimulated promoter family protein [Clostridia bacterium]|nr:nitrous oxide-stimulated promoter family protein [Clostridia bacterium]